MEALQELVEVDEGAAVFVTPTTIDWDPDDYYDEDVERPDEERAMIRGEWTMDPNIGFRAAVNLDTGLVAGRFSEFLTETRSLSNNVDRGRFGD